MIQWMLAIWSLVPLPFLKPAWTSGSSRFTYCWSLTWRILSITLLVCAAAAAKSLQSCLTLCDPIRRQPTRLPRPWESPGKNTGVGCHFLLQCMKVKSKSEVAQSCLTLRDPMDWSLPGSFVHGIFQARVLEWVAIAFSNTSVWDKCNCVVVWAFLVIAFLWDWNENWPFPVLWPLLSFPNLLSYWVHHFHSIILGFEIAELEFH